LLAVGTIVQKQIQRERQRKEIKYVMVTYGESVVFRPLLKKEER
jgi:hypothetical protein